MILSDRDIKKNIKIGKISILPEPKIEGSSVDLTLANKFKIVEANDSQGSVAIINPRYEQRIHNCFLETDGSYLICPGEMVLGATSERIKIDDSFSAFVQGRSSIARLGLEVECAGFCDAGFEGTITLEIVNNSKYPIKLTPGIKICQLIFIPMLSKPEFPYNKKLSAKYMGQTDPEASRIIKELK